MSEWHILIAVASAAFGVGTFLVLVGRMKASVEQMLEETFVDEPEGDAHSEAGPPGSPRPSA